LTLVTNTDAYCPLTYEVRYKDDNSLLATDITESVWLANDGSTDITINTNDNSNENTGSPLELKIVTTNGAYSVDSILSLTILPDCS
jgi:hypothetical protein